MKEKIRVKGIKKRLFSVVLALVMAFSLMQDMSIIVKAESYSPSTSYYGKYNYENSTWCTVIGEAFSVGDVLEAGDSGFPFYLSDDGTEEIYWDDVPVSLNEDRECYINNDVTIDRMEGDKLYLKSIQPHEHAGMTFDKKITSAGGTLTDGNYCLTEDVKLSNDITISGTVNICLNGHVLQGTGNGSVITNSGTLTITDCNNDNLTHNFLVGSDGKWTLTNETANVKMLSSLSESECPDVGDIISVSGGCITGGSKTGDTTPGGGGVYVTSGETTLESGNIIGNIAHEGGGVSLGTLDSPISQGTFNMSGGVIVGNRANRYGGGVRVSGNGTVNLSGGKIIYNVANANGNGLQMHDNTPDDSTDAIFNMSGGQIYGNHDVPNSNTSNGGQGGGVLIWDSQMTMTGGQISNNSSSIGACGGVVIGNDNSNKQTILGGSAKITNNAGNNNAINNLRLYSGRKVTISNPADDMNIGISTKTTPENNPVIISESNETDYSSYFTSDNTDYTIWYDDSVLKLGKHVHNWKYTIGTGADANQLTAKCEGYGGCTITNGKTDGVTLTITATSQNYSGTAVTANYGAGEADTWKTAIGSDAPTITYEKKGAGSTWSAIATAPSGVGEYRAVAKVTKDTTDYIAYKEFTISKADITSVTFTEPTAPAYGGTPASSVAGTGANYSGAISWSPAATTFGYSTAYTATITLTADDNHKFASGVTIPTNWTKDNSSTETALVLNRTYTATEAAPHTCGSGVKQDGQAATCTADGFKDYYKCGGCNKLYKEAACTNEIIDLATWKATDGQGRIAALGHAWGYNASGATLTATCTRDSAHTATLTLTASSTNYSGSGVEPTITYGTTDEQDAWKNAGVKLPGSEDPDAPAVTKFYYNADSSGQKVGDALDSAPVNAGKYVVEVNITYGTGDEAGQKASVTLPYEINKAAAPAAPSGLTATPPQYIGGNDGKITGVDTTMEYSTDGTLWRSVTGTEITGLSTGTVKVRVKETENTNAGTAKEVTIPDGTEKNPAPAAPTGLTVVPASALGASDGKITGVDPSTMEYSLDNGANWINVPGTEIIGLEAGKNVQVRLKATATHHASIPNTLMINYHTHSWSWKFDKTSHWQECECGAKQNEADHSYVNGKCICGSKKAKQAAVHSDVKEEHSAPEAVRAAEELFLPLNIVEHDKTGVNRDHFGIVPDKAYNLTAYVTIQGFVSAINKIEKANPKANTVSIYTGKPFAFNKRIVETIQKGGKTIIYYFYHKGHLYSVTVPATVDASKVLEKAGFAGPLYVGQQLGTTKLVK